MKTKQFCSVCKEWLDMEVVPTSDGDDDDGVIWYRCPQCQGFLPKLKGSDKANTESNSKESGSDEVTAETATEDLTNNKAAGTDDKTSEDLQWDSPADFMSAEKENPAPKKPAIKRPARGYDDMDVTIGDSDADKEEPTEVEPVLEYAAMLAALDPETAAPYRPWETYDVGQCIFHLAWNDCGVVVAKEDLPGGRQVIKAYFETAGVVRLIEKAPQ